MIGKKHLFKKSILLIKAWCFYESRTLGANHGLISTYALETLVLYIFNLFHKELKKPLQVNLTQVLSFFLFFMISSSHWPFCNFVGFLMFQVLLKFLTFFSSFEWDKFCVSLSGPVPLSSLPEIQGNYFLTNFF